MDRKLDKETERPNLYPEHPGFFVTEVDSAGNLSTNICNIVQFSITYACDFTAHTCSKHINKSLFTVEKNRKITSVDTMD